MRIFFSVLLFFYCSFINSQSSLIVPPDCVLTAFKEQYLKKNAIWSLETGLKDEDITFEAKFNLTDKITAYALYDKFGVFKKYRTVFLFDKLPKKAQTYLQRNYGKSRKLVFFVVNNQNETKYESQVKYGAANYTIYFDSDGNFEKRIKMYAY